MNKNYNLKRIFKRSRLLPGQGTRLEHTASGIRIHASGGNKGGGSTYSGFCKVAVDSSADTPAVMIFDGAQEGNPDGYAGYAVINDETITMPEEQLFITGERGIVSAVFTLSGSGSPAFSRYLCTESIAPYEHDSTAIALASFAVSGGEIRIIQQHTGVIYGWIFRACYEVAQ